MRLNEATVEDADLTWRGVASSANFVRRRDEVLDDLWKILAGHGIDPIGEEQIDASAFVLANRAKTGLALDHLSAIL